MQMLELSSILNGRFFSGEGAKEAYDRFVDKIKEDELKREGRYVNLGEERTKIAEEGGELNKPESIVLDNKKDNKVTQFEAENKNENPDGSTGDYIE